MATTSRPISELSVGIRDTTGAVVASGKARFYLPGTTTPTTVYSDDACTTGITQPLTLNAGGQYPNAFVLEATRMVVKDSTESTTYYDGLVNVNRHDAVYVTSPGFNSGNETTLESALAEITTSTGSGANVKESTGATARAIKTVLYEREISVKDFGAVGDGTTPDHVAIQAAEDRLAALGGGVLLFPKGTYLINSTLSKVTVGVSWKGAGRGICTIKNSQTTSNAVTINMGSAVDCKLFIRDLSFTASTTSSGKAIGVTNGDRIHIQNTSVALHRTGIDVSATTSPWLERVWVESTDDNAAAVGVANGVRGRIEDSEILSGTTNGTGITCTGVDARIEDTYVSKFATGISLTGARSQARGCHVTSSTTGVTLGANSTKAQSNYIASTTTGISVGAFSNCVTEDNEGASNTTDLSVNSSATSFSEFNRFTTVTSAGATPVTYPSRYQVSYTTSSSTTPTWAPTHNVNQVQIFEATSTSSVTLAITNPTVTSAQPGDRLRFSLVKTGANNIATINWGTLFGPVTGGGAGIGKSVVSGNTSNFEVLWDGSNYRLICYETHVMP